jgi:hypothetical protein
MGRRFITARDVDDVVAAGRRELQLEAGDRLTDLARERARDRDVTVIEAGASSSGTQPAAPSRAPGPAPGPAGSTVTTSAPSGAPARASRGDGTAARPQPAAGPPRRQLRAAVRAGVVAEFGGTPEGLDAAIGRVFDRLGIPDD